jgi:competence protein ComEC
MASSTLLSKIPILRVIIPFMIGITTHRLWHCWWAPLALIVLAIAGYQLLSVLSRTPSGRMRWRPYYTAVLALAALSLGWLTANIHCPPQLTAEQRTDRVLTGRIIRLEYTDFSMRLTVDLLNRDLPQCKVLVSTRGCDYTMRPGDVVSWQGDLIEVGNMGNPGEMDYANYLLDSEGIRYQQHLPVSKIKRTGQSPTFFTRMANVRRDLQSMVFNSRLSPQAQQFVVALLLGNSRLIDKATRQEFSAAGVAHILALSGLHVGFIALIIWWLLFPLDYLRLRRLRLFITLAAIILFAVFTGLSPSVVRATIMIGLVFASLVFYRRSQSLNALALAALGILVFTPSALFSVGFQLSFITVGAILLFARLPQFLESRYKWVNKLTTVVITSLVAMLATIALSAHYFHTVSFMSVLTNLMILPVLPVFMVLGALFLLVTAAGMHWQLLNSALDSIYSYICWATGTVNAIPGSHIGGVYVSTFGVIAYFVVIALIIMWLYRRNYRYLLASGCVLVMLLAHSLWVDARTPKQGLIVFNSFDATPLLYYNNGKGYVWIPDDEEPDSAAFSRYYAGFLAHHEIGELQFITSDDTLHIDGALIKPPFAHLMGHRLLAVGSGKWKHATTTNRLSLDDIIVTKRYHGTASKLRELFQFDRLIISDAHYESARLQHECDSLGIHSVSGAISF